MRTKARGFRLEREYLEIIEDYKEFQRSKGQDVTDTDVIRRALNLLKLELPNEPSQF